MNQKILKFFLLLSLILIKVQTQTVNDFTFFPEDNALESDFIKPLLPLEETYHSSYYFSNSNSAILTDPRSGMSISPYMKVI